jgi:hypothetical protein
MLADLGVLASAMEDPQDLDIPGLFSQSIEDAVIAAEDLPDLAAGPLPVARPDSGEGPEQFDVIEDRLALLLRRMRIEFHKMSEDRLEVVSRRGRPPCFEIHSWNLRFTSS